MRMRRVLVLLLACSLLLWLAACSSTSTETGDQSTTATASGPSETTTESVAPSVETAPATTPDGSPGVNVEVTPAGEGVPSAELDISLPSIEGIFENASAALDALSSYRYTTHFEFVGENDGQPETGSLEITGAVVAPDQSRVLWQDLEEGSQFELIEIGGRAWMKDEDTWSEVPVLVAETMSQAVLVFAPAVSWAGFYGELEAASHFVAEEAVNGIPARHYTSTYNQWAQTWEGELVDATADVWIALDGFPVRYRFSATAVDEDGVRGSISWSMDVYDVNSPFTIEPPQ